ncbi:hypothetical protein [Thalassoglobus polymorphus]|uniref:Ion transport protein n=1 Tax=Thalassoglobus polymorphus TaxID=2527994 RepID=A0A517QIK2_9PLAN|nr:hypothetical protein [Thalassoglobus polymorphus]QDT31462.1 hypothetical protein Mal48_06950 [Thalassoglobus polymorphus]
MNDSNAQTSLDHKLAMPMFVVTLLWLGLAGIAMHLLSDIDGRYIHVSIYCGVAILVLWLAYFAEAITHWRNGSAQMRQHLKICLFPPLRLGCRDHRTGTTVWIPGLGWRVATDDLANEIDFKLSYAMIAMALLVLPLLGVEYIYTDQIKANRTFGLIVQIAQAFIWFAFAGEFLLMITLVSKKIRFIKEHWLDLAIICLPMIAFMRIFRLGGSLRLTRLSKTAKVFRLRGTAMRAWRAILILQIVDRIIHRDPHKRLRVLKNQIAEKKLELESLQEQAALVKNRIAELEESESAVKTISDS